MNLTIEDLKIGNIYSNQDITETFKCSSQGGMRKSNRTNTLVLIVKHNNPLYDDQWTDDGILNYTGMGTSGNQKIDFSQNRTLAISKELGIKVHLFESYQNDNYYYLGEVELFDTPFTNYELDRDGKHRTVIKFPLKKLNNSTNIVIDINDIKNSEKEKCKALSKLSLDEIQKRARQIDIFAITRKTSSVYKQRNLIVCEYTKRRANGVCDLCGLNAPFKNKEGIPYLESHHVINLSKGGPDAIYNTVALCPNCHKRMHVLNRKGDREKLKSKIFKYLNDTNDLANIKKYKKLFYTN